MENSIFQTAIGGLPPNLVPNPPASRPEAPGIGDAMVGLSPFSAPLDNEAIIRNLMLDRPLKLFIPNREQYPGYEFRVINSIPQELADAQNKGWRPVDAEKLTSLFTDLVAGTTKEGKQFRPILMSRAKEIGEIVRKRARQQLASVYAGLDPRKREINHTNAENVTEGKDSSRGIFDGAGMKIRV